LTDTPPGFVPPEQPPTVAQPKFAPPSAHYPPNGPVYPAPRVFTPPPAMPPRKLSKLATAGIIVGATLVFAGTFAGGTYVVNQIGSAVTSEGGTIEGGGDQEPLLTGAPSEPTAVDPTVCDFECFGDYSLSTPTPSDIDFERFELTEDYGEYTPENTVTNELEYQRREWALSVGTPDECFVTWPNSPLTADLGEVPDPERVMLWFQKSRYDEWGGLSFSQATRRFETSTLAEAHMAQLDTEIRGCTDFSLWSYDEPIDYRLTLAPALDVPANVAVISWVESSDWDREYVFEMQRGNRVVRTTVLSDGTLSETQVRELASIVANQMGKMNFDCKNAECN